MRRLSIGLRITRQDPGHTHFNVFAALTVEGDDREWVDVGRGKAGTLTLRTDEFRALVDRLEALDREHTHLDVYMSGEDHHPCRGGAS